MPALSKLRLPVVLCAALSAGVLLSQLAGAQTDRVALARPGPKALNLRVKAPTSPSPGPAQADRIGQPDSTRRVVGTTLGVVLLLLCILYWSDGYGALGLRSSLAARYQERKA